VFKKLPENPRKMGRGALKTVFHLQSFIYFSNENGKFWKNLGNIVVKIETQTAGQ